VLIQTEENSATLTPFGSLIRVKPVKPIDAKSGPQNFARCLLCYFAEVLAPARASGTLDQEIFENKRTFAAVEGSAARYAGYFAVRSRSGRGLNPNDFVLRCAVRTLECGRLGAKHNHRMRSQTAELNRQMKKSDPTQRQ
jgi:hypothetical protein